MNINLYALRAEITEVSTLIGQGRVVLSALGRDFELAFTHPHAKPCLTLLNMLADRDAEVARIYTSLVDDRDYVEWVAEKPLLPVVITDEGTLLHLNALPPEEFPLDDAN